MNQIKKYLLCSIAMVAWLCFATTARADIPDAPPSAPITAAEYIHPDNVDSVSGTISITQKSGYWELTATPKEGWRFLHWSDLSSSDPNYTANPRNISDLSALSETFTATFQRFIYTDCYSAGEFMETANTVDEENTYGHITTEKVGNVWRLTAVPESDSYTFAQWSDGNASNPREIEVDGNSSITFYATFIPKVTKGVIDSWSKEGLVLKTTYAEGSLRDEGTVTVFYDGQPMYCAMPTQIDPGVYSVDASYVDAHAGKACHIVYKDGSREPVATLDATIPVLVDGIETVTVPNSSTGVHVLDGGVATLADDQTIAELDIYAGGKAVVDANVTASSVTMRANGMVSYEEQHFKYPDLLVSGKLNNTNSSIVNFDYALDYYYYYPFSLPYTVNTAAATYRSGANANEHFAMYEYDVAARAAGSSNNWKPYFDYAAPNSDPLHEAHKDIVSGVGYEIFSEPEYWDGTELTMQDMYGGIIRFPMTVNLNTVGGEPARSIPVAQNDAADNANKNWNLIGIPYLSSYNGRIMKYKDDEYISDVRYVMFLKEDEADAFVAWDGAAPQNVTMYPFSIYFIQFKEDVNKLVFEAPNPAARAAAPARRKAQAVADTELSAGITLAQAGKSDHTGLLIGDEFTEDYDIDADLIKMNSTKPTLQVFALSGSRKLTYIAVPAAKGTGIQEAVVPIGYTNAAAGQEMTFAIDTKRYPELRNSAEISELNLIDNVEGITTNLLESDYTCTAYKASDSKRFSLGVHYVNKAPQIATDICDVPVEVSTMHDGVYDLLGRRISTDAQALRRGVYIVVENGQARKEVVR